VVAAGTSVGIGIATLHFCRATGASVAGSNSSVGTIDTRLPEKMTGRVTVGASAELHEVFSMG
jgi:hypothetical protein